MLNEQNVERERDAEPEEMLEIPTSTLFPRRSRFPLEFLDRMQQPDEPVWLIKDLMPATGLLVLYGASGSGKSFLALDVGLHVAAGRSWAGRRVRQAGVIYVASEAGRGMRKRVLAAVGHHGFSRSIPFALITVAPDLGSREGDARTLVADIRAQLPLGFSPGLVILDTLARSMVGADESGSAGMGVVVANAEMIGRELGALVMPIHHSGKDTDRGMRGSSSLQAAADTVWRLPPDGSRRLQIEKMKEDVTGGEVLFDLRRVLIGVHEEDEITTCVVDVRVAEPEIDRDLDVEPEVSPEAVTGSALPDSAVRILAILAQILERDGITLSRYRLIPKDVTVIRQADLRESQLMTATGKTAKSRKSQIDRSIRLLEQSGLVRRHDGYLWLTKSDPLTPDEEKPVEE